MQIDRQRFLLLATSIATGCRGGEMAPSEVPVAPPIELDAGAADEPITTAPEEPLTPLPSGDGGQASREAIAARCQSLSEPSGPFCEGFDETVALCPQLATALRAGPARRAVDCLSARSGTAAICGYQAIEACFFEAVAVGSAGSADSSACSQVMARCGGSRWTAPEMNLANCTRALGAVSADLREQLVACMTEGCGIKRCVYNLID